MSGFSADKLPLLTCIKCGIPETGYYCLRNKHSVKPGQGARKEADMSGTKESLAGRVMTMTELVSYQEGAVISRTLVDKKIGTVTVFAFGEGEGLSEHTVPYDAFIQILDGDAEVTIAGTVHQLTAGQMIIMPADRPHLVKAVKRFKMLLVMIRA
jgi:quercetin dioxygenase-like cupin family protein